jgi:large subunit ribosomal protein L3
MATVGLIGKKLGQTRVYDDAGAVVCVTVVQAGPNRVVQCKTEESDGYNAVQLGYGEQNENRMTKPLNGHYKKAGVKPGRRLKEFRDFALEVQLGDEVGATIFEPGDHVDATGLTKGRGFQGVVKRYNFGGGPKSHGQKGFFRRPGSVAAGSTPGWVDKGKKMPGQMGQKQRTVQSMRVVQVREDDNLLLIEGAIPGAKGDYVVICEAVKKPKAGKR